jgi:urea transporter
MASQILSKHHATWSRYADNACSIAFCGNIIAGLVIGALRVKGRYWLVVLMACSFVVVDMVLADTTLGPFSLPAWFLAFGLPTWVAYRVVEAIHHKTAKAAVDEPKLQDNV